MNIFIIEWIIEWRTSVRHLISKFTSGTLSERRKMERKF